MSDNELAVESLTVRRAPGFDSEELAIDNFSPGVNVIHGPNGAGKTTIARSIQSILWPQTSDERSSILGQFSIDEEQWRVDLVQQRARYQLDGNEANGPNLPSHEQRSRYHLSLHDLLQHETRNESFARRIQQESIGGYDLDAAHSSLGFTDSPSTRGINEYDAAKSAQSDWQKAKQAAEELKEKEARLPTLEAQLEDAKNAKDRVELYTQAIEYQQARADLKEAEAELDEFPEEIENLSGDEADRVEELTEQIEELNQKIEDAEEDLKDAEERLEDADLPSEGLEEGVIEGLEERCDELETLENRETQLKGELERARKRREAAIEDIPGEIDQETLEDFEPAAWAEIEEFAKKAERLRADREAYQAIESWFGDLETNSAQTKQLERGSQALEGWLAASGDTDSDDGTAVLRIAALSAGLVGLAGIALGALVNLLLYSVLLIAAGLLWYGYRLATSESGDASGTRQSHREAYERLDIEDPERWSSDEVRERLNEIYSTIAEAHLHQQKEERRDALTSDADELSEREDALSEEREQLIEQYGVAPDITDIELVAMTRRILDWQEADSKVNGRESELSKVSDAIERERERLESELEQYGYDSVTDHAEATKCIRNLDNRAQTHQKATDDVSRAKQTIQDAEDRIDNLRSRREELYSAAELSDGELSELTELCDQVEGYESAAGEVERKQEVLEKEKADLQKHPDFETELLDKSEGELREAKDEAEEVADNHDDLTSQISKIEAKIEGAKQDYDLEEALENRQRALDDLEERLEADVAAMAGDVLVEHLKEKTGNNGRPEVFEYASDILARITRGRYELDIGDSTFRAYDTVRERGFSLEELSSGTRIQLLLAVRIAFVEKQESGVKLPLLLDETLANSDDYRAEVIIQSFIELARDGRQVFYFTAQGDEVAKWERAMQDTDSIEFQAIDLADNRGLDVSVDVPPLDDLRWSDQTLPDPTEHDHGSYGQAIDVPPFSPREGASAAHVWYLVEDTALVDKLLRLGIETWGQLETLLDRTDGSMVTDDADTLDRIRRNGEALNEFVKCWEVGRGERVDRLALEETNAVSDNFIDDVTALAESVDGDAERIIERLRAGHVDRFREGKMDQLERYFEENGYIQQREPLDSETIRARVVSRLARSGLSEEEAFDQVHSLFKRLVARSGGQKVADSVTD